MSCRIAKVGLLLFSVVGAAQATEPSPPDFSGVWLHSRWSAVGPGAFSPGATRPKNGESPPPGQGGTGEFLRAFSYQADGSPPPFQPWAADVLKRHTDAMAKEGRQIIASVQQCLPMGIPVFLAQPYPYRIIQSPDVIAIVGEANWEVRLIHMNRQHPANLTPSWYGDSIGRWEGDTLIVDTIGQNDKTQISGLGIPKTNALHLVERYREVNDGQRLEIRITLDDPGVFTAPWEAIWVLDRRPDIQLLEYICAENEQDSKYMKADSPDGPQGKR